MGQFSILGTQCFVPQPSGQDAGSRASGLVCPSERKPLLLSTHFIGPRHGDSPGSRHLDTATQHSANRCWTLALETKRGEIQHADLGPILPFISHMT